MAWDADDATKHTKKAKSPTAKRQFAHVANSVLKKTGDEGRAIRAANSVVAKRGKPACKLTGEALKEHKEHPWTTPAQAKRIAADHRHERHEKAESPKTERKERMADGSKATKSQIRRAYNDATDSLDMKKLKAIQKKEGKHA